MRGDVLEEARVLDGVRLGESAPAKGQPGDAGNIVDNAPFLVGGPDGIMIANVIASQFGAALNWPLGSALALVMLYEYTGDKKWLGPLPKFFEYYMPWWEQRVTQRRDDATWPFEVYHPNTWYGEG